MMNIIIFILSLSVLPQSFIEYEQLALNFFIEEIYSSQYSEIRKLEFTCEVVDGLSKFEYMQDCFDTGQQVRLLLETVATPVSNDDHPPSNLRLQTIKAKIKRRAKWELSVWKASKINEVVYVRVDMLKGSAELRSYFISLTTSGQINGWCSTGVMF